MTSITATNPLMAAANTSKSPKSSSSTASTPTDQAQQQQSEFLSLLVTQLKEQNPLDPTDGTQFVTQLAQFSSLNELVNIRATLQGFSQTSAPATAASVNPFQAAPTDSTTKNNSTQGA